MSRAPVSRMAVGAFGAYVRRYLRRHVDGVHVAGLDGALRNVAEDPAPLVVFLTHASWWDPLVGALLATGPFGARTHRAVIDARALERYAVLERVGFVGLDREGRSGARSLLRLVDQVRTLDRGTLWLTPQGKFTDPRVRPLALAPGLAHVASRLPSARVVPLAIEYPMGSERLPQVRMRFGEARTSAAWLGDVPASTEVLTERFTHALTATADRLADDVMHGRDDDYERLLDGRHGVGGIYDLGRRVKARLTGRPFEPRHGGNLPTS